MSVRKLQFWNNVLSANQLGAGSILPMNRTPVIFDFLSEASEWHVPSESAVLAYQPGIAGLKNGGLTTESTLSDGKTWQATPFDTIQDTLTLVPGGNSTPEGRADFVARLLLLQRQAQAYQIQSSEYRPVNICVNEVGDAGDRFSQIYDIQWAISGDMFAAEWTNLTLTLTITRYPYWTPIPLGTNPKWYTFLNRGLTPDEFLVPSELALFPTNIGAYAVGLSGGSTYTVEPEGYTPDIGFGSTVIDWATTATVNGSIRIGDPTTPLAPVPPNTLITATLWIRSESASYDAVPLRFDVMDQGISLLFSSASFTVTATANWVKISVTGTTGAGTTGVILRLIKNTSAVTASYDIYGVSVKLAANPMSLTDYGNTNANLRNWVEADIENIWTRADPANLRLNYVDIAAEDVPGDAPALLSVVVDRNEGTSIDDVNLYMARRLDCLDDEALYTMTFMAQGSTLNSPTGITSTYQADAGRGITSTPGGAASNRYTMQFVTGAGAISDARLAEWQLSNVPQGGKFAVFLRGGQTAGAAADIPMYIRIYASGGISAPFIINTTSRTLSAGISALYPALTYMGILDVTQIKNAVKLADGLGVNPSDYTLQLRFGGRTAGAAATYRVTDLLLVPYDDLFTSIIGLQMSVSAGAYAYCAMYDNTGYLNQNANDLALLYFDIAPPGADLYQVREVQGQPMTLEPGRDNRLYFLLGGSTASPTNDFTPAFVTLRTRLNIVPQWRRWRSV